MFKSSAFAATASSGNFKSNSVSRTATSSAGVSHGPGLGWGDFAKDIIEDTVGTFSGWTRGVNGAARLRSAAERARKRKYRKQRKRAEGAQKS